MRPIPKPVLRASGNEDVIKLLEAWLKRAKEHGQIGMCAIVAVENLKHVVSDFAGTLELVFAANWGLDTLKYQLLSRTAMVHQATFDTPKGDEANKICYDISSGPACFDFLVWLVLAKMNMIKEGAKGPLRIGFKMIDSPSERIKHDKHRAAFYKNVIFPSLSFVGAVTDAEAANAMVVEKYTLAPIVDLARQGYEVPLFSVPAEEAAWVDRFLSKDPRPPIVITLREVKDRWEHRNSNMAAWLKFAEYLSECGERVLLVRDTDTASEKIPGYDICPAASKDVRVRLALYERAKCNLFVSNGPFILSLFGTRPYLMFVETNPMSVFFPETPQWWKQWQGIHAPEQFPWSKPTQQIIWKRDNYENLVEAWDRLYPMLDSEVLEAAE